MASEQAYRAIVVTAVAATIAAAVAAIAADVEVLGRDHAQATNYQQNLECAKFGSTVK